MMPAAPRGSALMAAGLGLFAMCWITVGIAGGVAPLEEPIFRFVNGWGDWLEKPAWPIMQLGSLAAVTMAAAVALLLRRPALGAALASAGVGAWALAKVVKALVGRGRPEEFLVDAILRPVWEGPGFPSGHAAVAFAIVAASVWELPRRWRPVVWLWAGTVAILRMYVGAHLPLDVIAGAGLGLAVGQGARWALGLDGKRLTDASRT